MALFVSSKVGAKEDEEFVQLMDVIDCLPPGVHEMVIAPRPANVPKAGFVTGDWTARFEPRTLDDIRALGRNTPEDDRAFAAAARVSQQNLALYRTLVQPLVRAVVTEQMAKLGRRLNPLRMGYTMFADTNPWMKVFQGLAASAAKQRKPVSSDNPWLVMQEKMSTQIMASLHAYRVARDQWSEKTFFGFYGNPWVQAMLGISANEPARPLPANPPDQNRTRKQRAERLAQLLNSGGFDAALTRAVLYATAAERVIEQRCALTLNVARQQVMHLSLAAFKALLRDQFTVLQAERERAVDAIAQLVPNEKDRKTLMDQVQHIVAAGGPPNAIEQERLKRLKVVLASRPHQSTGKVAPSKRPIPSHN
jgi:hypothetical protein